MIQDTQYGPAQPSVPGLFAGPVGDLPTFDTATVFASVEWLHCG